jgi:hypothetical protein
VVQATDAVGSVESQRRKGPELVEVELLVALRLCLDTLSLETAEFCL